MSLLRDPEFYSAYWKWWLITFAISWAIVEAAAVITSTSRATLSNFYRDWLRGQPTWVFVTLVALSALLFFHFYTDLKR